MTSGAREDQALFEDLVVELTERVDVLAATTLERVRAQQPAWMREQPFDQEAHDFTRSSIVAELEAMRAGLVPESCPAVDLYGARRGAQTGSPLTLLLSGYRAGHQAQWHAWVELVEGRELPATRRRALLQRGSRFLFDYAERVSTFVAEEYESERRRVTPTAEQRRLHLVKQLIAGEEADTQTLGYPLEHPQLGFICWGPAAAEAAGALIGVTAGPSLSVAASDEVVWVWVVRDGAPGDPARAAFADLEPPPGARVAVGEIAEGPGGFRLAHLQALSAYRAAKWTPGGVVFYRDAALEDLATRDAGAVEAFVAAELRGLDGDDTRSQRLRTTLLAYFRAGQNAKAAAAALGVHQQTVGERLRAAERTLGYPVADRRSELETALRVRHLAGGGL